MTMLTAQLSSRASATACKPVLVNAHLKAPCSALSCSASSSSSESSARATEPQHLLEYCRSALGACRLHAAYP